MSHTHLATASMICPQFLRMVLASPALAGLATTAVAQSSSETPCGSYGRLAVLGTNADATASILTALGMSTSGFVLAGTGGRYKLYEPTPGVCAIASAEKEGWMDLLPLGGGSGGGGGTGAGISKGNARDLTLNWAGDGGGLGGVEGNLAYALRF